MKRLLVGICGLIAVICAHTLTVLPDPQNPSGYIVYRQELEAVEASFTSDPVYELWGEALATRDNSIVDAIQPGLTTNPGNVQRAERVFSAADWDYLASFSAPEYTYTFFLRAIGKFPAFCGDYTDGRNADDICKKSIIFAFAHYAQETGAHIPSDPKPEWRQALYYVREMGFNEGDMGYNTGCGENNWQNARWPCYDVGYFGRGAKQLSYHYNYGPFSEAMFNDASRLLSNPREVAETWLNLASSIWFFLTPQPPKPAMLHVIDRSWTPTPREVAANIGYGFGTTINIINGGLECGAENQYKPQPLNRIKYYQALVQHFNIPVQTDEIDTCHQQTPYGSLNLEGATDVPYTNWDRSWGWFADRPGNYPFECKLVSYQSAYNALVPGDYEKCVSNHFGSHDDWPVTRVVDQPGFSTTTPAPTTTLAPIPTTTTTTPTPTTTTTPTPTTTTTPTPTTTTTPTPTTTTTTRATTPTTTTTTRATTPATTTTTKATTPTPTTTTTPAVPPPAGEFTQWVPGQTQVSNGERVTYNNKCFIAQNNPGPWETPLTSNWFWEEITCGSNTPAPTSPNTSAPTSPNTPAPTSPQTTAPTLPPSQGEYIVWKTGETVVANGDEVTHLSKCFKAKNQPGVWETPYHSNWFWDEIVCVT